MPLEQDIPVDIAEREYRQISYYQVGSLYSVPITIPSIPVGAILLAYTGFPVLHSVPHVASHER